VTRSRVKENGKERGRIAVDGEGVSGRRTKKKKNPPRKKK
jgi:hypothetical protein